MGKVAKLVTCSFMTRVVVDENATDDQIIEEARERFLIKLYSELGENIEDIVDDEECPYDPEWD